MLLGSSLGSGCDLVLYEHRSLRLYKSSSFALLFSQTNMYMLFFLFLFSPSEKNDVCAFPIFIFSRCKYALSVSDLQLSTCRANNVNTKIHHRISYRFILAKILYQFNINIIILLSHRDYDIK